MRQIVLLGLGPGDPGLLTRVAWEVIQSAKVIYLRTRQHPTVAGLPTDIDIRSYDELYESSQSYEEVYQAIVDDVLKRVEIEEQVIYAVPGHPFIAEATAPEIAAKAREKGIKVKVIEGLSFLEPVFSALGIDPFPTLSLVDAILLGNRHFPPFPTDSPAIVAQIYSRQIANEVKLTLMSLYPDKHPVKLIHAAGTQNQVVESVSLYEIDRSEYLGNLSALYLPPLGENTAFEAFGEIIAHLRAPDGCPWDREQTHQTLRPNLLEETYEALEAIDADDPNAMAEEFGDLLLQIVLHAQIASEYGEFTMADVIQSIANKIIRRHPHVFGDLELRDSQVVIQNWEKLKEAERAANGEQDKGLLDGVSIALPALLQAETYQKRAARVGFDWKDLQGVIDKLCEEVEEVRQADNPESLAAEIGDMLFAVVNLARWLGVDAESALREANARFRERFSYIERAAKRQGKKLTELTLDEMESFWQEAKQDEKKDTE